MAFWHRINQAKLFKRCYNRQIHSASLLHYYTPKGAAPYALENPIRDFVRKPADFCFNVRFFAAPYQAKAKKEEKDTSVRRLNGEITARYVRLVNDEGHTIVPFIEALELAKQLKLDLVEVQRNADPPVCKIMDYHRELYQQQLRDKERAKSKSDTTLRKGECKEVRFAAKTEQKDLQMKADTVVRLMERGYRVKCVAMGTQKKGGRALAKKVSGDDEEDAAEGKKEDEDEEGLGALLSRLTTLIEDVAVVENEPRVEKRQAYVIVRHVKFGPKKGGAKKSKDALKASTAPSTGRAMLEDTESGINSDDDILSYENDQAENNLEHGRTAYLVDSDRVSSSPPSPPVVSENRYKRNEARNQFSPNTPNFPLPRPENDPNRADSHFPSSPEPSFQTENRYRRSDVRGEFPPVSPMDNRRQNRRDTSTNFGPTSFPNAGPAKNYNGGNRFPSSPQDPSLGAENRYKRSEVRNQFSPMTPRDNRNLDRGDPSRFESQYSNQRR